MGPSRRSKSKHQIQKYKRTGDAVADSLAEFLPERYRQHSVREGKVQGNTLTKKVKTPRLNPLPHQIAETPRRLVTIVPSEKHARADWLISVDGENYIYVEVKKSPGKPEYDELGRFQGRDDSKYTPEQREHVPDINKNQGVGLDRARHWQTGKWIAIRGKKIITTVTLYKADILALMNGQIEFEDLIESRKGLYSPNPQPTPAEGIDPPPRKAGRLDVGDRATSTTNITPGTEGSTPRPDDNSKALQKQHSAGQPVPDGGPDVRIKPSFARFGLGLAKYFIIGMLQDIALGLFVNYFEGKVNEATNIRIRTALRDKVFSKIGGLIRSEMKKSLTGHQPKNYRVYIGFRWYLVMKELDEDVYDVVVWFGRFAAGTPGFGEVFDELETQKDNYKEVLRWETKRRLSGEALKRRRVPGKTDLWRQPFLTWVLVHDPDVVELAKEVRTNINTQLSTLQYIHSAYVTIGSDQVIVHNLEQAAKSVQSLQMFMANAQISQLHKDITDGYGAQKAGPLLKAIDSLLVSIEKMAELVVTVVFSMHSQDRQLLEAFLGTKIELK